LTIFRSGQSIFSRPKPIDISTARRGRFIDLEIEREDDDSDDEAARPLVRNPVLFDAGREEVRKPFTEMPRAAGPRDAEDVWAEIG
jgi:hypothetical protein